MLQFPNIVDAIPIGVLWGEDVDGLEAEEPRRLAWGDDIVPLRPVFAERHGDGGEREQIGGMLQRVITRYVGRREEADGVVGGDVSEP